MSHFSARFRTSVYILFIPYYLESIYLQNKIGNDTDGSLNYQSQGPNKKLR